MESIPLINSVHRIYRSAASMDPRYYQIVSLATLLGYGVWVLDFGIRADTAAAILIASLCTQFIGTRIVRLSRFDSKSALISALSLILLLRTNSITLAIAAAFIAIASKFIVRRQHKHIFNPTCFGIVVMLTLSDRVWVSAGQWGSVAFFGFLVACLGSIVVTRAARADVTFAFLAFFSAVLFGRALWLGDPLTIPWHQLQNGALLLFAFFMISDPKSTPDARLGRVLFAGLVALGAGLVYFGLYRTNGLLWSLAVLNLSVPVIDLLIPGEKYQWIKPDESLTMLDKKGKSHEIETDSCRHLPQPAL